MSHDYPDSVPVFYLKRGDSGPRVWIRCEDGLGRIQPILAGDQVWFYLRDPADPDAPPLIEAAGTIEDADGAEVSYIWQPGDSDLDAGTYEAEFEIRNPVSGKRETYPNDGYIQVQVTGDLADAP